jgi:general stress protein 26
MAGERPLELDDDMRDAIGSAFESRNVVTVAYNGNDGWPHVSRRGSTQVFGPQQLAMWIRKRDDGLAKAIETRPQLTLFYIDLVERGVVYTFYGLGRLSTDRDVIDRVWAATPEREQAQDPDRKGIVVLVDLERIVAQSRKPDRNFVMERNTSE